MGVVLRRVSATRLFGERRRAFARNFSALCEALRIGRITLQKGVVREVLGLAGQRRRACESTSADRSCRPDMEPEEAVPASRLEASEIGVDTKTLLQP
jgi:hypothetical protein